MRYIAESAIPESSGRIWSLPEELARFPRKVSFMQFKDAVHNFTSACERLIASMALQRSPTEEEALLVKFYCNEVLQKIDSSPANPDQVKMTRDQ
jgi:hypothetical protein